MDTRQLSAAPSRPAVRRPRWALALFCLLALSLAVGLHAHHRSKQNRQLAAKLSLIEAPHLQPRLSCAAWRQRKPLVLLALGQSNAGNHGALAPLTEPPIALVSGRECLLAGDPLPGATGSGGSIWRRLPTQLQPGLGERSVVISVLAVDASSIADWTRPDSALRQRLETQARALLDMGLRPDFVLWQQGEADARLQTAPETYLQSLVQLRSVLNDSGIQAPFMLARSTRCRSAPHAGIRQALEQALIHGSGFVSGPDTDTLLGPDDRLDGCHFNARGLDRAAAAWSAAILAHMSISK